MTLNGFMGRIKYLAIAILLASCVSKEDFPVTKFYNYDFQLPLDDSVRLVNNDEGLLLYNVSFASVHDKRVTGLLSIPTEREKRFPVVILLHGLGDRKTVDYIEAGNQYLLQAGYAVLRIDIDNHGDRKKYDYEFELTEGLRYWTRDLVAQTVFDLRRSVDFLATRKEINAEKIGFFGISLGGVIGTIFSGVDERVKVPVIALAGGNLSLMFGMDAFSEDAKDFFSIIDPINFVQQIAPRPLLMINAENDEIVNPITSKLLFAKAKEPKEIIWYPSRHRDLPIDQAYPAAIKWFQKHL